MQQKWFQLKPVSYNIDVHHDDSIQSICQEAKEKRIRAICLQSLIEKHPYSQKQIEELKDVSEQLINMQQLYDDIVDLQKRICHQLQESLSYIELILKPIIDYQELPNFTNLNLISGMMKENTKEKMIAVSYKSINVIKQLLNNFNCESEIIPKDANFWSDKGQKFIEHYLYNEAIVCFDKAIFLKPHILKFYYKKCKALNNLQRFEEAIDCYSETILIDPHCYYSWYYKGILLLELKRYLEAMSCFDTALSFGPEIDCDENSTFYLTIDGAIYCYDKIIKTNLHPHLLQHAKSQLNIAQGFKNIIQKQ